MNNLIQKLAEQAETWNANGDKCEVDLEKFAELIVRECASLIVGDDPAFILKHFGVEP